MSTLISANLHTIGCRRSAQKKSIKIQDDPEDLRKQRVQYENYLRRNKRDKILEDKRKVLEKLNWTVAWSDDEEDTEEGQVEVDDLMSSLVNLDSTIKSMRTATIGQHDANLNSLSRVLDLCRRKLSKEVYLTFSSTARYRKPIPGALTSALLSPQMFEIILRLLATCHSSAYSSCGLTITREVTSILADMTRFDQAIEILLSTSTCKILVQSLQKILHDLQMDIVCFLNSFNTLNHILSSKNMQSHLDCQTLFENVLFHLTRASKVYGPEENVINLYIKSMTQLLTVVIPPLFKQEGFLRDQNFCTVFDQILSVLESLFELNDIEVTLNVMRVIALVSSKPKGLQLLFQRANLMSRIISINESFVDFVSEQAPVKVSALSYEIIANMLDANNMLCAHFVNENFFDQAYNGIKINDLDIDFNITRILLLIIQFEPRSFDLFFDRKLTDYFASIFFMSDNRTQLKLLEIVHQLTVVATPEQAVKILLKGFVCCTENYISASDHSYESTHKVLEIHRNLMLKCEQVEYLDEARRTCFSVVNHLENLMACKNERIVQEAIYLMDNYFDQPLTGASASPTSRVH